MLIKEYRICLPLTVAEYRIAQLYMIQKKSREESTGRDSGVEIIKNHPYENGPGGNGQYTFKIYHVGSHLPSWLRNILPPSALRVEEEAWNAYPYTRTVYKVPFVDKLTLDIETYYFDDAGHQDDVFKLNPEEKEARIVDYIDIVQDAIPRAEYKPEEDPTLYVSRATGRGPLSTNWRETFAQAQSVTHETHTAPPTRTPDGKMPTTPLNPLPKRIMSLRKTMVRAHRQVWTWQDEWYGLTIEDIRRLEAETARALACKMTGYQESESATEHTDNFQSTDALVNSSRMVGLRTNSSDPTLLRRSQDEIPLPCDNRRHELEDSEEQDMWRTFKRLRNDGLGTMDCEHFETDDDAMSFVSCRSHVTGQTPYLSAVTSAVDGLNLIDGGEDLNVSCSDPRTSNIVQSAGHTEKWVFVMVVHGGCLLDHANDIVTKRSDINTLRKTIDSVVANHYPVLRNRITIQLVPCPTALGDTLRLLARVKTSPVDPKLPIEVQLARDVMPLGSIPFFLTASANYSQLIDELATRLNTHYAEFLRSAEGAGFNGSVCLIADSMGAILTHDLLNAVASSQVKCFVDSNVEDVSLIDAGVRRWREPLAEVGFPNTQAANEEMCDDTHTSASLATQTLNHIGSLTHLHCSLDFPVQIFFMLGSPIGLLLAYRQQLKSKSSEDTIVDSVLNPNFQIATEQVCNLFHPTDPCGFRIEPLLHPRFEQIPPVVIPQYARYPLGDSQPVSLVETLVRQTKLFAPSEGSVTASDLQLPDGNRVTSSANLDSAKTRNSWEQATLVAFKALKEGMFLELSALFLFRRNWWGQTRIDFSVHCPEGVQSLLARARAPIFHASYWESTDVAAFFLRQISNLLGLDFPESSYVTDMDDELTVTGMANLFTSRTPASDEVTIHGSPNLGKSRSRAMSGDSAQATSRFRLKRQSSDGAKNVKSNHRANDVIVLEGGPQIITARFMFGLLDLLSLSNEKIFIQTRSYGGSWKHLGTEVTDSSGRIRYRVPDHRRFGIGLHPILLTPESDAEHPIQLALAVVPPHTEAVVFSVDGSFAASLSIMGKDPKVRPGAVDVARHWQGLGYLLIYLSARPDMQQRRVNCWLANHNFPQGISLFVEGISTDPLRQKAQLLRTVSEQVKLKIHCAYGSGKDVNLYRSLGLPPEKIFVVGRMSRNQSLQSTPLTQGYAAHLGSLISGHPVSKQASGAITASVCCSPFDLPTFRASPQQTSSPHWSPASNEPNKFSFGLKNG
ncbi:hypothetical protein EG68_00276 [Paragonimus skrjabini miyazakii]|uniref:DDHD domain-containing protein n=1 Tax=Paragonimus skrjabini miyazakii TaxID=59628 RepID=A0A8S9Z795_9TREM|nr:hypothetical protein EG68_00276 [Paragonimus skrjabini miyazakii]